VKYRRTPREKKKRVWGQSFFSERVGGCQFLRKNYIYDGINGTFGDFLSDFFACGALLNRYNPCYAVFVACRGI
jgi:hypothetical protein